MPGDGNWRSVRRQFFLVLFILFKLILGLAENTSPNDSTKADSHSKSISRTGLTVLLIFLGVATILLLSFFLLKMWQKKRREEQHARLLKLFEEDNELEVELGLRD